MVVAIKKSLNGGIGRISNVLYNKCMNNKAKIALILIGILLLINGIGNIIDDARVLTYDIASILSGIGFIILGTA